MNILPFVESFDSFSFNDILGNAEGAGGEISTSSNFIWIGFSNDLDLHLDCIDRLNDRSSKASRETTK